MESFLFCYYIEYKKARFTTAKSFDREIFLAHTIAFTLKLQIWQKESDFARVRTAELLSAPENSTW